MSHLGLTLFALVAVIAAQASAATAPVVVWAIPDEYFPTTQLGVAGGFLGELLIDLTNSTGLTFTLVAHPELRYDSPNPDGSWTGTLIGAVSQSSLTYPPGPDLVGPDLTVSAGAEQIVDFLTPIQTYTLQIVVNKQFGLTDSVQYLSIDDEDLQNLKNSPNATLNKIYQNVQNGRPGSIVDSNAAGVAKVLTGNFAYICESVFFDSGSNLSPGTALAGGNLGNGSLTFAVRKGYALEATLNNALINMKTTGALAALLSKYNL